MGWQGKGIAIKGPKSYQMAQELPRGLKAARTKKTLKVSDGLKPINRH